MNLNTYQIWSRSVSVYPEHKAIEYLSLGLCSEAGEFAGKTKKYIRDLSWNSDAAKQELGDVLWYVARLADEMNMSLEELAQLNHDKLVDRQARNVIQGNGDNR